MANKRLTDLTELTTPADGDFLYIVDVSDTTESAQGTSKKIRKDKVDSGASKENIANKQNDLTPDGTGTKYPTVDAVNAIDLQKIAEVEARVTLSDGLKYGSFYVDETGASMYGGSYTGDNYTEIGVDNGIFFLTSQYLTKNTSVNFNNPTQNTTLYFPAKTVAGAYTLATTDDNNWTKTGNDIQNNNSGNIGLFDAPSSTIRLRIGSGSNTDANNTIAVSENISTSGTYNSINSEARALITANTSNRIRGGKFVSLIDMGGFNSTNAGGGAEGIEGVARVTGLGTIDVITGAYFRTLSDINDVSSIVKNAHGIIVPQHAGALLSPFEIATGAVFAEQGGTTRSTNTANLVIGSTASLVGNLTGLFTGNWNVWSPSVFKSYSEGTQLIGTQTDNGVDKVQVNGTISASPATLSTQLPTMGQVTRSIVRDALPSSTLTGTLTETILKSYEILGGTFGSSDFLNIPAVSFEKTGTLATANVRIYINTTNSLSGATQIMRYQLANTVLSVKIDRHYTIDNGNIKGISFSATGSVTDIGTSTAGFSSATLNTANTFYIITTATLTNIADSIVQTALQITN